VNKMFAAQIIPAALLSAANAKKMKPNWLNAWSER
jgi:hypothetical protein